MKAILRCVVVGWASIFAAAIVAVPAAARAEDEWQIQGRVVDEQGKPVEQFVAAAFWSSNGNGWNEMAEAKKRGEKFDREKLSHEEGTLVPLSKSMAKSLAEGRFEVTVEDRPRVSIFATDAEQRHGGYVVVEKADNDKPVTITLRPLVRVQGKIFCPQAERTPDWTIVVVHPPGDQDNGLHFTCCDSLKGEFSLLLPPGPYDFDVYSGSPDAAIAKSTTPPTDFGIRVDVPADKGTLDLGVLNVLIPAGRGDYSQYYGQEPPALEITDARGVSKEVKLADFRGKWVLLDFWTLECSPCIDRSLPELTKLYEEHAADRGRFEILSICVNDGGQELETVAQFERAEGDLAENIWHGKRLPFPVLIDGKAKTRDAYGISGVPRTFLIDPAGHLVKDGDEEMLVGKLGAKQ